MGRLLAALLACLAAALPAAGAEGGWGEIDGRLSLELAVPTSGERTPSKRDALFELGWQRDLTAGWAIRAVGRGRYEDRLEPDPYGELEIRELVLRRVTDGYTLRLGRQQVVWGKADGLRLLDVVNPLDLREFLLDDYEDSRIPLWMVQAELYRGDGALQILVIPDLTFNGLAEPGGRFHVPPAVPPGVPASVRPVAEPPSRPETWEYGFQWSSRIGRLDWTLNGLYGWNDTPVPFLRPVPGGVEVAPRIVRSRLLGASGDLPLGPTVLRFEALYTPDGYRAAASGTDTGFLRQRLVRSVVGLDWIHRDWLLSPQLFHERLLDPDAVVRADRELTYATFLVRRTLRQERLELRIFALYGLDREDLWVAPRIGFRFRGRLELSLGADLLGGRPEGLFGRFDDRDRVTAGLALHF